MRADGGAASVAPKYREAALPARENRAAKECARGAGFYPVAIGWATSHKTPGPSGRISPNTSFVPNSQ